MKKINKKAVGGMVKVLIGIILTIAVIIVIWIITNRIISGTL